MLKTAQDLLKPWGSRAESFSKLLTHWYRAHQKDWPWRSKFRESGSPYPVWISEIMLQQTTIQAVLPAYHRFLYTFPNVFSLAAATEDQVREACRGLGYYRRFRMMHEAARLLVSGKREGEAVDWPKDFAGWKELPGIGDYTAAAISSIAFGFPKAVVDGNVERVFARLFNLRVEIDPKWKKVFQAAGDRLVVGVDPSEFNQGLMELGQSVCIKGTPRCSLCPVSEFCAALAAGTQTQVPLAKAKIAIEEIRLQLYIQEKRGRIGLLRRRDKAKFLKGTWSFPNALETNDGALLWETEAVDVSAARKIGHVKHGITKHRIDVVVNRLPLAVDVPEMKWFAEDEIEEKLVSNMDRKAFHLYLKVRSRGAAPLESLFG